MLLKEKEITCEFVVANLLLRVYPQRDAEMGKNLPGPRGGGFRAKIWRFPLSHRASLREGNR
jgi:hypothetical protein